MRESRLFRIEGKVQGVWFRDSTRERARHLGLTGHALNLPDGSVEVLACGAVSALDRLEEWLHDGPPMAKVTRVVAEASDAPPPGGFRIG